MSLYDLGALDETVLPTASHAKNIILKNSALTQTTFNYFEFVNFSGLLEPNPFAGGIKMLEIAITKLFLIEQIKPIIKLTEYTKKKEFIIKPKKFISKLKIGSDEMIDAMKNINESEKQKDVFTVFAPIRKRVICDDIELIVALGQKVNVVGFEFNKKRFMCANKSDIEILFNIAKLYFKYKQSIYYYVVDVPVVKPLKSIPTKHVAQKITQLKLSTLEIDFIKKLGWTLPHTELGLLIELAGAQLIHAFNTLSTEVQDAAIIAYKSREYSAADLRKTIKMREQENLKIGIYKSICDELSIEYDNNSYNIKNFMDSIKQRKNIEIIEQRYVDLLAYAANYTANVCSHIRDLSRVRRTDKSFDAFKAAYISSDSITGIIEDPDCNKSSNDYLICTQCNKPTMCRHMFDFLSHHPIQKYFYKLSTAVICKICNELLFATDHDETEYISVDSDLRKQVWSDLQRIKQYINMNALDELHISNATHDNTLISYVFEPLQVISANLQKVKIKSDRQTIYNQIYLIVLLSMMRYKFKFGNTIEDIIRHIYDRNQQVLSASNFGTEHLRQIYSDANERLGVRLMGKTYQVFNNTINVVNAAPAIWRYKLKVGKFSSDKLLTNWTNQELQQKLGTSIKDFATSRWLPSVQPQQDPVPEWQLIFRWSNAVMEAGLGYIDIGKQLEPLHLIDFETPADISRRKQQVEITKNNRTKFYAASRLENSDFYRKGYCNLSKYFDSASGKRIKYVPYEYKSLDEVNKLYNDQVAAGCGFSIQYYDKADNAAENAIKIKYIHASFIEQEIQRLQELGTADINLEKISSFEYFNKQVKSIDDYVRKKSKPYKITVAPESNKISFEDRFEKIPPIQNTPQLIEKFAMAYSEIVPDQSYIYNIANLSGILYDKVPTIWREKLRTEPKYKIVDPSEYRAVRIFGYMRIMYIFIINYFESVGGISNCQEIKDYVKLYPKFSFTIGYVNQFKEMYHKFRNCFAAYIKPIDKMPELCIALISHFVDQIMKLGAEDKQFAQFIVRYIFDLDKLTCRYDNRRVIDTQALNEMEVAEDFDLSTDEKTKNENDDVENLYDFDYSEEEQMKFD